MKKAVTLIAALLVGAASSKAVMVSVNGSEYSLAPVSMTGTAYASTFGPAQPWWGDYDLAEQVAKDIGGSLGVQNWTGDGLYFPYAIYGPRVHYYLWDLLKGMTEDGRLNTDFWTRPFRFAVASPVAVQTPDSGSTAFMLLGTVLLLTSPLWRRRKGV